MDADSAWTLGKTLGAPVLGSVAGWVTALFRQGAKLKRLESRVVNLQKGISLALEAQKHEFEEKVERLEKQVTELRHEIDRYHQSQNDFAKDAEFAQFVMEDRDRWEVIQRTLGYIEGKLQLESGGMQMPQHPPRPSPKLPPKRF